MSRRANTSPLWTLVALLTNTAAMRSLLLKASCTCRRSTLPCRVSSVAAARGRLYHHQAPPAAPARRTTTSKPRKARLMEFLPSRYRSTGIGSNGNTI